ncbi:peptidylprolyl isomerase [Roseicella aquatilis]|uniref:Parvulin-like PPIase n=1 Tax=Roseicella aquatilis TaxID=2527868 RepID=A0A4R4DHF9_9PROT|nr:peptidylprolyl isomerase [Roseicella aquatilis]TCZ59745.1 rotamase [Roseicella aquatilis]
MPRSPLLALPLALVLAGPALAQRAAAQLPPQSQAVAQGNRIVAVVNGEVVSRADVIGRARLFALNAGIPVAPEVLERLAPQVTRLLIDERLRLQEVQRRRMPVTDADVADAIEELEKRNNLPAGGLRQQLQQIGVAPRVLYDQIRTQIGWARVLRQQLGPNAEPGQAEVDEAVRAAKARVGQPEYLLSEIFVPVDDPAAEPQVRRFVEEVIGQLRRGTPFPIAATQFGQSQTALQGGDLGWVRKDDVDSEVAAVMERMPVGAISNPIKVPGGFQIITLRQKREAGRDIATLISMRQAYFPFSSPLDPNNPTQQQRDQVEKAQRLAAEARNCGAVEAAARAAGGAGPGERPVDPGTIRLDTLNPPPLKELLSSLAPGKPSQPILTPDGVMVMMVCSKETRNLAEFTPGDAKQQILRDRIENLSRQLQRDLRRRAQIETRS